ETTMLDGDAPIHGDRNPGLLQVPGGLAIHDPLLHEEETDPAADGLLRDLGDVFGPPEDVDDIDLDLPGDLREAAITGFAQKLPVARVDRDDPVSGVLKVLRDRVRRARGVRRAP